MLDVLVLALHGGVGDAQRYRCLHLQEQLNGVGITCEVREFRGYGQPLPDADVIIFHRVPHDRHLQRLMDRAREHNTILLFDTDDLIFDDTVIPYLADPKLKQLVWAQLYRDEAQNYRRMIEACDAVIVSTDFLAEQVRQLDKPVYVHRNACSLEMLTRAQKIFRTPHDQIIIGYASGTPTHDRDFASIETALQNILDAYPQTELRLVGYLNLNPTWHGYSQRLTRLPFIAWRELPACLANFDINLAPLEIHNPFCQAKSEIKYLEAALVKVPTVASATESFRYAIRHNETGLLVTTHRDWQEALTQLIENEMLRRELGERAFEDVVVRYDPVRRAQEFIKTLDAICHSVRSFNVGHSRRKESLRLTPESPQSEVRASRRDAAPSWLYRAYYALRYRGLKTFLLQAFISIRSRFSW